MSAYRGDQAQRAAADEGELDFYPTPPWAARACAEKILQLDPAARSCWEPACGEGHMLHGLGDYFDRVAGSDVFDYGAGAVFDFKGQIPPAFAGGDWDWICTNPPFKDAEAFLRVALQHARRGVALLLRTAFREGGGRYAMYCRTPAAVVAQFAERVPMRRGRWDPAGSTATPYALFVWVKRETELPILRLVGHVREVTNDPAAAIAQIIPPGQRKRLSRDSDVARFGAAGVELRRAA